MMLLDVNESDSSRIGIAPIRSVEPQRVVVILSNAGSISERLIDAVQREFPGILVEQVTQVEAACKAFSHPVALLLVDIPLVREAEAAAGSLLRAHPHALTAVIEPYDKVLKTSLADVAKSPLIRSVLPMDLRLDVWLSIIRLMLCGGEYFPPGSIVEARTRSKWEIRVPDNQPLPIPQKSVAGLAELTAREMQILEMVSFGLQNKLIAAKFALSEHTVKVHLHNIIRKLRVHNRTEAAARFRDFH
jgi:DNA-binding NarL/FixJ family response regulator